MTLERDSLLIDRYRIIDILGQGGMGAVYRVIDENLGLEVAVKENLFTSEEYTRQFKREAVILASLRHTNLPRVSDHFVVDNQGQYLVMDYIEGEDLRQRMDRLGVLAEEEVILMGAAICDALDYLHGRTPPILHRDIKPGNIKINPEGTVYLVDFGLAKIVMGTEATTTGARAMTPGYSSPEQYGTARTDERSDIYSLGATLYAALTGSIPEDALARAMEQADLTEIRRHNPKVSRRLSSVIEKAISIHPEDRYQSPEELKRALLNASSATKRVTASAEITVPPPPLEVIEAIAAGEGMNTGTPSRPEVDMSGQSTGRLRRKRVERIRRTITAVVAILILGTAGLWLGSGGDLGALFNSGNDDGGGVVIATDTSVPKETEEDGDGEDVSTPTPTTLPTITATPTLVPVVGAQLTATPTAAAGFTEGEALAFASDRSGSVQIWLYEATGSKLTQLTEVEGGACQPTWSPDGRQMVYVSPCEDNLDFYTNSQIFAFNLETKESTLLVADVGVFDPAWSPDGKYLLYVKADSVTASQIHRLALSTGESEAMTEGDKVNINPEWSPDGSRFIYTSSQSGGVALFIKENDPEAEAVRFTRSVNRENLDATWSPLDDRIVFVQKPEGNGGIRNIFFAWLEALELSANDYEEFRFFTGGPAAPERDPDFSPNGLWIAVESWPDGENHDIYILHWDGLQRVRITNDAALDFDPAFRPPTE